MKNLTRILALIMVFSLVMCTAVFAKDSFTDVKESSNYAEAINTLANLGIIKGYEDGTFKADQPITRAEAVAIVNRIQNLSTAAKSAVGASLYTDVATSHWALGDINLATQMGTISGDGNGLFRPEDQVSYQEMVKMLVCALNYGPIVAEKGGWPTGYLVAAQENGVLENTVNGGSSAANRGIVAQLTFNALTAPMMEQIGYGTDKNYEVKDTAGAKKCLLTEKLSIYKLDATVVANDVSSVDVNLDKAEVGEIALKLDLSDYPSKNDAFYGVSKGDFKLGINYGNGIYYLKEVVVGDSDIAESLGLQNVVYVKKNADKDWEVLYCTSEEGMNKTEEIAVEDIEDINADETKIEVDVNGKTKTYKLATDCTYILNGEPSEDNLADLLVYKDGQDIESSIKLVYTDTDDKADFIFIDQYITDRVEDVNPAGTIIYLSANGTIDLDTEDNEDLVYSLTIDGKNIKVKNLEEGDILTYRYNSDKTFYDIKVSRATVTGTLDGLSTKNGKERYTIAGKTYELSVSALAGGLEPKMVTVGKSGTFYLDAFGKIAYVEKGGASGASGVSNYAVVVWIDQTNTSKADPKYGMKLFTEKGKLVTYDFASKVNVYFNVFEDDEVVTDDEAELNLTTKNDYQELIDAITPHVKEGLIDYSLNSNGEINSVTLWNGTPKVADEDSALILNVSGKLEFNETNNKLGKYIVNKNTVTFCIGEDDEEDWTIGTLDDYVDEQSYKVDIYGLDDAKVAGAIVMYDKTVKGSETQNIAVFVENTTVAGENGGTADQIKFFKNGDIKTETADGKIKNVEDLYTGAAFVYYLSNGYISEVRLVEFDAETWVEPEESSKAPVYVKGEIYAKDGNTIKLIERKSFKDEEDINAWESHTIPADANIYLVSKEKKETTVRVGTISDIVKNNYYKKTQGENAYKLYSKDDADNYIIGLRYYKDEITDVIIYKNFLTSEVDMED